MSKVAMVILLAAGGLAVAAEPIGAPGGFAALQWAPVPESYKGYAR